MIKYLSISLLLIGCGARKVEKNDIQKEVKTETIDVVKNDISINTDTKIQTKIFVNDSTKEEIEEIETVNTDGSKLIKRKIKRNKAVKKESNTNTQLNQKSADKTIKTKIQQEQAKESIQTKNIDKKQFDPLSFLISYWWLWLILLLVFIFIKKYLPIKK